jgi:hypothetical protein
MSAQNRGYWEETQTNTVSADGKTYQGTYDVKFYDLNGNFLFEDYGHANSHPPYSATLIETSALPQEPLVGAPARVPEHQLQTG